jgi:hypothetical protein
MKLTGQEKTPEMLVFLFLLLIAVVSGFLLVKGALGRENFWLAKVEKAVQKLNQEIDSFKDNFLGGEDEEKVYPQRIKRPTVAPTSLPTMPRKKITGSKRKVLERSKKPTSTATPKPTAFHYNYPKLSTPAPGEPGSKEWYEEFERKWQEAKKQIEEQEKRVKEANEKFCQENPDLCNGGY